MSFVNFPSKTTHTQIKSQLYIATHLDYFCCLTTCVEISNQLRCIKALCGTIKSYLYFLIFSKTYDGMNIRNSILFCLMLSTLRKKKQVNSDF